MIHPMLPNVKSNSVSPFTATRSKDLFSHRWLLKQLGMLAVLFLIPNSLSVAVDIETLQAIPDKSVTYKWSEAAKENILPENGTIEEDEKHGSVLKVTSTGGQNSSVELYTIKNPKIESRAYVLHGYVKYNGMKHREKVGFLEMWNTFQSGSYFTRGLSPSGPMMQLSGSSRWRRFELPFMISEEGFGQPTKLQFNVSFPDLADSQTGTVWLSDLTLTECQFPRSTNRTAGALKNLASANVGTVLLIGVAILGALGLLFYIVWRLNHRSKQSEELRRMQAMDFGK
jgi:hypothetical protein